MFVKSLFATASGIFFGIFKTPHNFVFWKSEANNVCLQIVIPLSFWAETL